jgi:hypothetical protein
MIYVPECSFSEILHFPESFLITDHYTSGMRVLGESQA